MYVVMRPFDVILEAVDRDYDSEIGFLDDLGLSIDTLSSIKQWDGKEIDLWAPFLVDSSFPIQLDDETVDERLIEEFEGLFFSCQLVEEPKQFQVVHVSLKKLVGGTTVMSSDVKGIE